MAARVLRRRAPSGRTVEIQMPPDPPVSSVASQVRFAGGSLGRAFMIGGRGYHDFAIRHMVTATNRERFLLDGREVVIAEADDGSSSVATLIGRHHELMTVFAGPRPAADRVEALFGTLSVDDHPTGMKVMARSATLLDSAHESITVVVLGRGSIDLPATGQSAVVTPGHRGAATRYGGARRAGRAAHPAGRRVRRRRSDRCPAPHTSVPRRG